MLFRNDINALRAFAILGVLFFHFDNKILTGGFVGVDVFFVISGYLMTSIIFREDNKSFSYIKFLKSRFKRIVPPIVPLLSIVLLVNYFILPPSNYEKLAEGTLASLTFLSNILYWKTAGYFDGASKDNFLLHTWSLSVEWQFYLLYPVVLVILRSIFSIEIIKWIILFFVITSFAIVSFYAHLSPVASFYLLPTRAWEMAAGALAYFFTISYMKNSRFFSYTGFSIILISYIFISNNYIAWPGIVTVFPVIGTMLVLFSNIDTKISTNKLLGNVGLYSYSIYLYHWPFLVFGYYFEFGDISLFLILLTSIIFAIFSFYFVEKNNSIIKNIVLTFLFFTIVILSCFSVLSNGIPSRFHSELIQVDNSRFDIDANRKVCFDSSSEYCVYYDGKVEPYINGAPVDYILIGDSHAASIVNSFSKAINKRVLFMGVGGCLPLPGAKNLKGNHKKCNVMMNDFSLILSNYSSVKIIVAARYSLYLKGSNELSRSNIKESIYYKGSKPDILQSNSLNSNLKELTYYFGDFWCETSKNYRLYMLGPVPEFPVHIPDAITKKYVLNNRLVYPELSLKEFNSRNLEVNEMLSGLTANCKVTVLQPSEVLCDNISCKSFLNNKVIYFDENHLTQSGSDFLIKLFKDLD